MTLMQFFDPRRVLSNSLLYSLFRRLAAGGGAEQFAREYLHPREASLGDRRVRLLDIGCGPADILAYLPQVDYIGFDASERYIQQARRRFGGRGRFIQQAVDSAEVASLGRFEIVLALGVLHHLDDHQAQRLFQLARDALAPRGRLVSIDPCFTASQSWCARRLVSLDRGQNVRAKDEYLSLAKAAFPAIHAVVRHDLNRIPYTHLILECADDPRVLVAGGRNGQAR